MKWQDMLKMDDEALLGKGVAALGARRKLLKVFDQVKAHCQTNVSPLTLLHSYMLFNHVCLSFCRILFIDYLTYIFLFISPPYYIL